MIRSEPVTGSTLVVIDRPEKANALDAQHCRAITDAIDQSQRRGDRAMIITGVGSSFCAGADIEGLRADGFHEAHRSMLDAIVDAPMPVIAAVNGHAIGAGMQLALAADLRVVEPGASFAIPTARLGLAVDTWTIARLAALVGGGTARRLLLTCERIPAHDPALTGLIDRTGGIDVAKSLADDLASMAPLTLAYCKTTLNEIADGRHDSPRANQAFNRIWQSNDSTEGIAARRERRAPQFTGL